FCHSYVHGDAAAQSAGVAADQDIALQVAAGERKCERVEHRLYDDVAEQGFIGELLIKQQVLFAFAELYRRASRRVRIGIEVVDLLPVEAIRFHLLVYDAWSDGQPVRRHEREGNPRTRAVAAVYVLGNTAAFAPRIDKAAVLGGVADGAQRRQPVGERHVDHPLEVAARLPLRHGIQVELDAGVERVDVRLVRDVANRATD